MDYPTITLIEHSFANLAIDYNIHTRIIAEIQSEYDGEALIFVADPENSGLYIDLDDDADEGSIKSFEALQSINISTISNTLAEMIYLTENKKTFMQDANIFYTYIELLNKYKCKRALEEIRNKSHTLFSLESLVMIARLKGLL